MIFASASAGELEAYLHAHIPLSRAMAVTVAGLTDSSVRLAAPLAPNINHRNTVFGGSAASLATLAAWSVLHLGLRDAGSDARIVIQRSYIHYEKPINGDFTAIATIDDQASWERFLRAVQRKGKGRIRLESVLEHSGERVGVLEGEFVALVIN
jgi:thioesterase domain-containing protein